jgi:hypothetical protein
MFSMSVRAAAPILFRDVHAAASSNVTLPFPRL